MKLSLLFSSMTLAAGFAPSTLNKATFTRNVALNEGTNVNERVRYFSGKLLCRPSAVIPSIFLPHSNIFYVYYRFP